jgi:GTP-binding protein YchF
MPLQAGIVGLPNVGKSTLFQALTSSKAEAANYPFCTIEPNVGIVPVPDHRLKRIQSFIKTQKVIPTTVEIVDIAGLVKGASKGEGLGNKFLGNIRNVDAILHVVRCFDDGDITHVEDSIDPLRDIETIETELIFADLEALERKIQRLQKKARGGEAEAKTQLQFSERLKEVLESGTLISSHSWKDEEAEIIKESQLITSKPFLFVCNINEEGLEEENDYCRLVREYAENMGARIVHICARAEAEIAELEEEERLEFLNDLGIEEPGLHKLARETYNLLGLRTYFTAGEKEIRAWTIKEGYTAPQSAGVIHTDFEKKFIKAEVYTIPDLEEFKTEVGLKGAGKLRIEGKGYVVQDGDVMFFRVGG